ncbi:MAG: OmpA family protein [Tannerellaceae bacterium]|jgi:peptidoglycan-associated lipoprotein|nr:OmpA family protein [Tannerellaceae bacterium]
MNFLKHIQIFLLIAAVLPISCKTPKLSTAEEKQRIGEYYEAAAIYRKVYAKTPPKERAARGYIAFRMGECNRVINNISRAAGDYLNALRYQYPDTTLYLRLGQTHQKRGLYAEAIKYYKEYLKINPGYLPALNGISGSELAAAWKKSPSRYIVRRMDKFNSRYSEFSPMLYGEKFDQLYFASSRKKAKDAKPSGVTGLANNNFYLAKQDDKGVWQAPVEIEDPVNTEFDEGVPSFTADGSLMYYTYCAQAADGPRTAEIYAAPRSSAEWGKGDRVAIVKDSVTTLGHPAVSPDGAYLYFVSDVTGGYGGRDIFRVKRTGNDFGPMENLGPQINTPGDEMFPYVRDSVTLYFASDGHPGLGGLDLFKATLDSLGVWHVENLKPPVNSMADDFGITFAGPLEKGFFSSNRNDLRGCDHIYSFELPTLTVAIEGIVADVDDNPLEDATVRIVGRDGLNEKATVRKDGSYRVELRRDVSYVMMASARGYLNQNFELTTLAEEKSETYVVDFFLSPIYRPVVVENIFYAFNQATLRPESKEALDEMIKLLNDNPNVTLEFGSHTDRIGSAAYNEGLAQRRAQSVVDYLIAAGIASDRLEAKGYGKSVPKTIDRKIAEQYDFLNEGDILSEDFVNALTPEQQAIADQINRRTEFKVLRLDYNLY